MLDYARWKYVLVSVVTLVALLFAAPNFFGEDQALQVVRKDRVAIDESARVSIEDFLRSRQVKFIRAYLDEGRVMVRFPGVAEQLQARDAVNEGLAATYVSALARASRAPEFFRAMGLRPMALGLDLRGGLHLLYQVDINGAVSQLLDSYEQDFRRALTAQKLPFNDIAPAAIQSTNVNALRISFPVGADVQAARTALQKVVTDMTYTVTEVGDSRYIEASLSEAQVRQRQTDAIQQRFDPLRALRRRQAQAAEADIVGDLQPGQQPRLLKHRADGGMGAGDDVAADGDGAVGRLLQPGDQAQQRGFAAAGTAEDGNDLSAVGMRLDVAQGFGAVGIGF